MGFQPSGLAQCSLHVRMDGDGNGEPYGTIHTYHTPDRIPEVFSKGYFEPACVGENSFLRHGDVVIVVAGVNDNMQTDTAVVKVIRHESGDIEVYLTGSAFQRMSRKIRMFWQKAADFF